MFICKLGDLRCYETVWNNFPEGRRFLTLDTPPFSNAAGRWWNSGWRRVQIVPENLKQVPFWTIHILPWWFTRCCWLSWLLLWEKCWCSTLIHPVFWLGWLSDSQEPYCFCVCFPCGTQSFSWQTFGQHIPPSFFASSAPEVSVCHWPSGPGTVLAKWRQLQQYPQARDFMPFDNAELAGSRIITKQHHTWWGCGTYRFRTFVVFCWRIWNPKTSQSQAWGSQAGSICQAFARLVTTLVDVFMV